MLMNHGPSGIGLNCTPSCKCEGWLQGSAGCKGISILNESNHVNALICGALWPVIDCIWDLALQIGTKLQIAELLIWLCRAQRPAGRSPAEGGGGHAHSIQSARMHSVLLLPHLYPGYGAFLVQGEKLSAPLAL